MCSQTASHSAIAAITGSRKSFGCGLVKRMRSIPSTASHARSSSPNSVVELGPQVAAPGVHVLAEQRDLLDAVGGEARHLGDDLAGPRLCSRPRTAGTMQYEHLELQPIETCTQALNARSRCIGRSPAKCSCEPEAAPRRLSSSTDPLAEVRDRAGPERDVHLRVELEDPLLLGLGVAAADGDDEVRVLGACGRRRRRGRRRASCPASRGSCTC